MCKHLSSGLLTTAMLALGLFAAGCDSATALDTADAQKGGDSFAEHIALLGSGPHTAGQTRTYEFSAADASTTWTLLNNNAGVTKGAGYTSSSGYPRVDITASPYSCGGTFNLRFTKTGGLTVTGGGVIEVDPGLC